MPPLPPLPPSPPLPPLQRSPPLPPLESGGAAAPSGDEWAALGSRPTRERERYLDQRVAVVTADPQRMEPGARCAAHLPKINAADVERMARVRNAGRIWDSPHTELDGNNNSWACSKPGQLVLH